MQHADNWLHDGEREIAYYTVECSKWDAASKITVKNQRSPGNWNAKYAHFNSVGNYLGLPNI